jgi:hypothetical protein
MAKPHVVRVQSSLFRVCTQCAVALLNASSAGGDGTSWIHLRLNHAQNHPHIVQFAFRARMRLAKVTDRIASSAIFEWLRLAYRMLCLVATRTSA